MSGVDLCRINHCNRYQNAAPPPNFFANCIESAGRIQCNVLPSASSALFCVASLVGDPNCQGSAGCLDSSGIITPGSCAAKLATSNSITSSTATVQSSSKVPTTSTPATTTPNVPVTTNPFGNPIAATPDPTQIASQPAQPKSDKVLSGGQAAGVAIGGIIAGAVIAGLLVFLLLRRKGRNSLPPAHELHANNMGAQPEKGCGAVGVTSLGGVEGYIPLPAEEVAIVGELSKLRGKVKDHVQSFYSTSAGNYKIDHNRLMGLATSINVSPTTLVDILQNPATRVSGLRLYLSWIIMTRCGLNTISSDESLLPVEVAEFASFLVSDKDRSPARLMLITRWKAISGALLHQRVQHTTNSRIEQQNQIVSSVTNSVLALFAVNPQNGVNDDKRLRNLEGIVKKASQFAFLLFSQKGIFALDWTNSSGAGIVVFPGLHRVVDDDGNVLHPPQIITPPEVEL